MDTGDLLIYLVARGPKKWIARVAESECFFLHDPPFVSLLFLFFVLSSNLMYPCSRCSFFLPFYLGEFLEDIHLFAPSVNRHPDGQ